MEKGAGVAANPRGWEELFFLTPSNVGTAGELDQDTDGEVRICWCGFSSLGRQSGGFGPYLLILDAKKGPKGTQREAKNGG